MARYSALVQAMQPDVLDQVWRRLQKEHTPWSPQVDRDELNRHLLKHILALRDEVLMGGYKPAPLRKFPMKKPDGKNRVLSAQFLSDKFVQRALLTVWEPKAEAVFHEDSFGYRRGRGVQSALVKVRERVRCGLDWVVDADIQSFFDSIPHAPLRNTLAEFVDDKEAMRILDEWLVQGAHHTSLLRSRRGIAQGAILSPLMCNLYLHTMDQALSKASIPFVRFADDFLLFASSKQDAEQCMAFVAGVLTDLKLALHPKKTRVARSHPSLSFLGEPLPKPQR